MKNALIIIDIQNDYFEEGKMTLVNSENTSLNAKMLLTHFREKKLPIIHIQHQSTREGATFFIPNTEGVKIHSNVKPKDNEKIIVKHFPNSFRETGLLNYLNKSKITDLVICGMMTHMCVDATTRAAKDYKFNIELISDACTTKDLEINGRNVSASEVQKSFLAALNYFYSHVLTTKEYLKENHTVH